jgi:thiol-disulfide isomerase/thioredoxin
MRIFCMKQILLPLALLVVFGFSSAQKVGAPAPEFLPDGAWFNSTPKKVSDYKGKVLLVNVWVHSCINCHNSLPTLRGWYDKYKAQGFEIVGVHTPEFASDKDASALKASLVRDGVTWTVFQDNLERTWKNYNNRFWPAFYFVDRSGNLRATHAGELSSRYPNAIPGLEQTLKGLLAEKGVQ